MVRLIAAIVYATVDTALYYAACAALWAAFLTLLYGAVWLWQRATLPRESPARSTPTRPRR